ncbi:MAG: hypothetical protein QME90_17020 [Thermodesulfobacteriota bacterium]|nr:hypothetical protein [Thermodesulfobacteriota bacterium]
MSELRKDPIQGTWVIIAMERWRRPSDFETEVQKPIGGFCPLCEGNENYTPPEIFSFRDIGTLPNSPGWSLQVVSNKFPVLRIEGELNREGDGIYDKKNGIGTHEVVIETPQHHKTMATLPLKAVENILWAYRERIIDLKRDQRLRQVLNDPPYNYIIHTSSSLELDNGYYHWHFEIIPRLIRLAGFEWGTGFYINSRSPEDATEYMKEVK